MNIKNAAQKLGGRFDIVATDGATALARLGLSNRARVLDVGTGSGNFAIFLALQGYEVTTGEPETDDSHYAGKGWAQNAEKVGVTDRIEFRSFDAGDMPFESSSFDAVFFFGVLHHVDEQARGDAFREALRVVTRGGPVVYFEPRREMLDAIRADDPDHPDPAYPSDYAGDAPVAECRIKGKMMDIYIYSPAGAEAEA